MAIKFLVTSVHLYLLSLYAKDSRTEMDWRSCLQLKYVSMQSCLRALFVIPLPYHSQKVIEQEKTYHTHLFRDDKLVTNNSTP